MTACTEALLFNILIMCIIQVWTRWAGCWLWRWRRRRARRRGCGLLRCRCCWLQVATCWRASAPHPSSRWVVDLQADIATSGYTLVSIERLGTGRLQHPQHPPRSTCLSYTCSRQASLIWDRCRTPRNFPALSLQEEDAALAEEAAKDAGSGGAPQDATARLVAAGVRPALAAALAAGLTSDDSDCSGALAHQSITV